MIKVKYLIIFGLMIFSSCSKEGEDITDNGLTEYNFEHLPEEVQRIISSNIDVINNSEIKLIYSTDSNMLVQRYRKNQQRNWLKEVSNNDEYIRVGDYTYRIRGNKGSPFVIFEEKIFYPDLNLDKSNYKTHKYYSVSRK